MTNATIVAFEKLGHSKAFELAVEGYSTLVGWRQFPLAYPLPESEGLYLAIGTEAVSVVLFHTDLANQALVLDLVYTEQSSEGMGYATSLIKAAVNEATKRSLTRVMVTVNLESEGGGNLFEKSLFKPLAKVYSQEIGS